MCTSKVLVIFCSEPRKRQNKREKAAAAFTVENQAQPFAVYFVRSVLRAMRSGSLDAINRFSRVLVLLDNDGAREVVCRCAAGPGAASYLRVSQAFDEELEGVPSWMFIRWIPQMMAVRQTMACGAACL